MGLKGDWQRLKTIGGRWEVDMIWSAGKKPQ